MDDEPAEAAKAVEAGGIPGNLTQPEVVSEVDAIAPRGDVVLDVHFTTSAATLRAARAGGHHRRRVRAAFRVDAAVLARHSRYFANLLADTRFQEARAVEAALAALALDGVAPADADVARLPWVRIDDDDEGSRSVGRELVFAELLRMLHGGPRVEGIQTDGTKADKPPGRLNNKAGSIKPAKAGSARPIRANTTKPAVTKSATPPSAPLPGSRWSARTPPGLRELAVLALQADRFGCAVPVAAHVRALRVRFPQPVVRAARDDGSPPGLANEEAIRQKILVAWLLDQPVHFDRGTRELILYGSQQWGGDGLDNGLDNDADDDDDDNDDDPRDPLPAWWDLPDGLEAELRFRRARIVGCIASVPRHFLGLYTSRSRRECKMGYGSSAACDSFQLGEMVRFLCQRDLLHLRLFGLAAAADSPALAAAADVYHLLATLRQCPAYQLDRDHVNCGLRTRMLPILDYIQAMLAASAVAIRRPEWRAAAVARGHSAVDGPSWAAEAATDSGHGHGHGHDNDDDDDDDDGGTSGPLFTSAAASRRVFRFTRAVAGDQRLRLEGNMAADRMARSLFTARRWNWTPED